MHDQRQKFITAVEDMLSDPIVVLMMRSDGIAPQHVRNICEHARARLANDRTSRLEAA